MKIPPFISIENKLSIEAFVLFGPASIQWKAKESRVCEKGACVCARACVSVCVRVSMCMREREVIGRPQVTITF